MSTFTPENPLQSRLIPTGEATAILPLDESRGKPIMVVGTEAIRAGFDQVCLQQALNARSGPGVTDLILNPDAHRGYGAPIGCVMVSPTHIYPGPVGVDIKCSMSLIQFDLPTEEVADRKVRRALINAINERIPTGAGRGQQSVKKGRFVSPELGARVVTEGASAGVLEELGIPVNWASRCEDAFHQGHDGADGALQTRLQFLLKNDYVRNFGDKMRQLGSYGGGNHFGECESVELSDETGMGETAATFGLKDGCVAFLSHCGSRGFGNILATAQFKTLQRKFSEWDIPLPGNDRELVYAPLGSPEANDYIDDLSLGSNFATVNHLLINALVLEAFQQVIPGVTGELVYFISHNIARQEVVNDGLAWVHRKGATRAFPAGHHALKETPFAATGHPILLPGNPREGSVVMVAKEGAAATCYSVNHGAGRAMGRKDATRRLDQKTVDADLDAHDILTNCRQYPKDEAPDAYKDFAEVLSSVEKAGLASTVAKLRARFVIKDSSSPDD